jgi:hypothetical protein
MSIICSSLAYPRSKLRGIRSLSLFNLPSLPKLPLKTGLAQIPGWPGFPKGAGIGNNPLHNVSKRSSYKNYFPFGLTLTFGYAFILFIK